MTGTVVLPAAPSMGRAAPRRSLRAMGGLAVLCASVLINALAIAAPMAALLIYDKVLANRSVETLAILAAGAMVLILAEAALRFARLSIVSRAGAHADFTARNAVMHEILADGSRAAPLSVAEMNGRMAAVAALREHRFTRLQALVDIPFGLGFLVLLYVIGGTLVLLPAGVCVVFALASYAIACHRESAEDAYRASDRSRQDFVRKVTRSLHALNALAAQIPFVHRFVDVELHRAGSMARQNFLASLSRDVYVTFSQVLIGSVIVASALAVLAGDLTVGGLAACTLLAGRALEPLQTAFTLITQSRLVRHARADRAAAKTETAREPVPAMTWSEAPDIVFDRVAFRSGGDAPAALPAETLRIAPGTIAAISCDRGACQTDLGLALLGEAVVTGEIRIGGHAVDPDSAAAPRARIAYLPREPDLPSGRLLDVLTGGDESIYADVRYLSHLLGLDAAVKNLPAGYDTMVSVERAGMLPLGIRQQIAICRVLARKNRIIVSDDTAFSLDARTVLRFAKTLQMLRGEATIVLLTDQPALRAIAQSHFLLAGGRLVAAPNVEVA